MTAPPARFRGRGQHSHRTGRLVSALLLAAMTLTTWPIFAPDNAAAQSSPLFQVRGPEQVEVGEPITFTLTARGVAAIGGYETTVLFDTSVASFHELEQSNGGLAAFGRDIEPLSAVQVPYGAAIGFVSCPVQDCLVRSGPRQTTGGRGNVELARITIGASQPGVLEVTFDATKLVNAIGIPLPLNIPAQTFRVQVGPAGSGEYYPAPAKPWTLPSTFTNALRPFDVTGGGLVTYADIVEVALEWQTLREHGEPCGNVSNTGLDINRDGCIDVSDMQLVAAQYSLASAGNRSTQSADSADADGTYTLQQATANTYVVNSTGDQSDTNFSDGVCRTSTGTCTLRGAMQQANNDSGASSIHFNIPGSGVQTIQLTSELPTLWNTNNPTTIDAYTQPGASPNTDPLVSNAVIMVQIQGAGEDQFRGMAITSPNNVVRGLAWYRFERAIWVYGENADENVFTGNFIGTNADGSYGATGVVSTQAHGMHIEKGAGRNRVGGTSPAERNVISGSARTGVSIWHGGSNGNFVYNNLFGLRPNGASCLPNRIHGVDMNYGASNNLIGGIGPGQRNVVTGNGFSGVDVSHATDTAGNQVVGNFMGTNVSGTGTVSGCFNNQWGVRVKDGVRNNVISDNVIGGNRVAGIAIESPPTEGNTRTTTNNTFTNNRIGVSVNDTAIPNPIGVLINGQNNRIGPGNIIANNTGDGVQIDEASADFNTITRNSIHSNGGIGIDLAPNGVTANDSGDGDTGPNQNLNFPALQSVTTTTVGGTACGGCTVEVFVADAGTTQNGEGRTFVGSGAVNTDGTFSVTVTGVRNGNSITATATDQNGNTSEFSRNVAASGANPPFALPGRIEVENYRDGGQNVGYFDTTAGNTGGVYRSDDVDIGTTQDATGVYNVGWVAAGEWLAYNVEFSTGGNYTFTLRAATPENGKSFHVRLNGNDVTGSVAILNTGGWQTWRDVSSGPVNVAAGTYTLEIRANTNNFNLNYLNVTAQVGSAPAAPSDLGATTISNSQIDLSWTDGSDNEANFVVERSFNQTNWAVIATLPANQTTYSDSSVRGNSTYFYRVTATNAAGSSSPSNVEPATTAMALPGRIQAEDYREGGANVGYQDTTSANLGGAYRADAVDIEGTADTGGGFNVGYTALNEWLAYDVAVDTTGDYTFTIRVASPNNGKSLRVEVDGVNVTGTIAVPNTGGFQTWRDVTVGPFGITAGSHTLRVVMGSNGFNVNHIDVTQVAAGNTPAAPSALTATPVSAAQIDLSWTDNSDNEESFVIERSPDESTWAILDTVSADTVTASDATVDPDTAYFYRMTSTNGDGDSEPSNTATATTPPQSSEVPAAPSDLTATTISNSQVDLSWTDGSDTESNFVVERSFNQTTWSALTTLPADQTTYSDNSVRVNTTYFYRVFATNSGGSSDPSNTASETTATALPGRIQVEDYREGGAGFGFQDSTTANLGGAYRTDAVDIQPAQDTGGGFNVGWTDTNEWLAYDVTVGEDGDYTFVVRVATPNSGKSMRIEVDGVNVTGSIAVPNTGGFQTWRDVTVGPFEITAGSHTLRLVTTTNGFNLNYFDVTQVEVGDPPAAPSDLSATTISSSRIDLSWTDGSDNESNFVVERSFNQTTWSALTTLPADQTTFSDNAARVNTTYFYRIVATNSNGSSSPSNTVSATTATALPGRSQAEDYREGGVNVGYQDTTSANLGGAYRTDAVDIEATTDAGGGFNIGYTASGEWLTYDVTIETAGEYVFSLRVASINTGRTFHIELDDVDVTGSLTVPNTGGFQTWTNVSSEPVSIAAGTYVLKIFAETNGFNMNYIDVTAAP